MTNVVQSPIDFQLRPVSHGPSSLGFGFGLSSSSLSSSSSSMSTGWQSTSNPQSPFHQLNPNNLNPSRPNRKRGHEDDPSDSRQDESMENRSSTPDRPRKAPPKRPRVSPSVDGLQKDSKFKDTRPAGDDVDVGVLLATLPSETLLPILMSLIQAHPSLKSYILPLIPRPKLATALQALGTAAKKLLEAYPYSTSYTVSQSSMPSTFSGSTMGFGTSAWSQQPSTFAPAHHHGGMRDSYIQSRVRPHSTAFVSALQAYLPYFSYHSSSPSLTQHAHSSTSLQPFQKDKSHALETFEFLSSLTRHVITQPMLTQELLVPLVAQRLSEEWSSWVRRVDEIVNQEGGMFGSDAVSGWFRVLDEFDSEQKHQGMEFLRIVRDNVVAKVGWLVGRSGQPMQI